MTQLADRLERPGINDRVDCPVCSGQRVVIDRTGRGRECSTCHRTGSVHPIIRTLIVTLPPPGTVWPTAERAIWLRWCAASFELLYGPSEGRIEVSHDRTD